MKKRAVVYMHLLVSVLITILVFAVFIKIYPMAGWITRDLIATSFNVFYRFFDAWAFAIKDLCDPLTNGPAVFLAGPVCFLMWRAFDIVKENIEKGFMLKNLDKITGAYFVNVSYSDRFARVLASDMKRIYLSTFYGKEDLGIKEYSYIPFYYYISYSYPAERLKFYKNVSKFVVRLVENLPSNYWFILYLNKMYLLDNSTNLQYYKLNYFIYRYNLIPNVIPFYLTKIISKYGNFDLIKQLECALFCVFKELPFNFLTNCIIDLVSFNYTLYSDFNSYTPIGINIFNLLKFSSNYIFSLLRLIFISSNHSEYVCYLYNFLEKTLGKKLDMDVFSGIMEYNKIIYNGLILNITPTNLEKLTNISLFSFLLLYKYLVTSAVEEDLLNDSVPIYLGGSVVKVEKYYELLADYYKKTFERLNQTLFLWYSAANIENELQNNELYQIALDIYKKAKKIDEKTYEDFFKVVFPSKFNDLIKELRISNSCKVTSHFILTYLQIKYTPLSSFLTSLPYLNILYSIASLFGKQSNVYLVPCYMVNIPNEITDFSYIKNNFFKKKVCKLIFVVNYEFTTGEFYPTSFIFCNTTDEILVIKLKPAELNVGDVGSFVFSYLPNFDTFLDTGFLEIRLG